MTRVGREDACVPQDIVVQGEGIEAEHCLITNQEGVVTLDPCGHACALDGVSITTPTPLTQGNTHIQLDQRERDKHRERETNNDRDRDRDRYRCDNTACYI